MAKMYLGAGQFLYTRTIRGVHYFKTSEAAYLELAVEKVKIWRDQGYKAMRIKKRFGWDIYRSELRFNA